MCCMLSHVEALPVTALEHAACSTYVQQHFAMADLDLMLHSYKFYMHLMVLVVISPDENASLSTMCQAGGFGGACVEQEHACKLCCMPTKYCSTHDRSVSIEVQLTPCKLLPVMCSSVVCLVM